MSDHDAEVNAGEIHPFAKKLLWLDSPNVQKNFIWVSVVGLVLTALLMTFFPNKHPAPWEVGLMKWIAYAVIGGFAYTFVVLSASPLFKLLSRSEDFYAEGDDHDV